MSATHHCTPRTSTSSLLKGWLFGSLLCSLLLAACSGGGGGGNGGSKVQLDTLSGQVNGSGGVPLSGVTVSFEGNNVLTDNTGAFLIPSVGTLPTGTYLVEVDGSTTNAVGTYPSLEVSLVLTTGQMNAVLSQVVTLPNLDNVNSAAQSVGVDAMGATLNPVALAGPTGDIALSGPTGTVITLDGTAAMLGVDLNVTPVPADELPMPLPENLVGSSFVTIQPGNADFATPSGTGLDVTLPNTGGLPIGASVDIWSFDHEVADWVNRSQQTGNQGTVVDLGGGLSGVSAVGVITEGGWHAPAIPINVDWASTVQGRVLDSMSMPLEDVSVFTNLGQFTSTEADGSFSLGLVPAYDLSANRCSPIDFTITASAPPLLGSITSDTLTVMAADIQVGTVTDVGDLELIVPLTGCVTGIVNGLLSDRRAEVELSGTQSLSLPIGPSGTFATCGLTPGNYNASVLFAKDTTPTSVNFDVLTNAITTITLQSIVGGGSGNLTVTVLQRDLDPQNVGDPVEGAQVFLQGTDAGSAAGLLMITNSNGQASFSDVDGPFQITAINETVVTGPFFNTVSRNAASVADLSPPGDQVTIAFDIDLSPDQGPQPDATLEGDITGNIANCSVDVSVSERPIGNFFASDDGMLNDYSFGVPSGFVLDLFVTLACGTGNTEVTSAGFVPAIAALTPGETRTVDVDVSSAAFVDFDVPLGVTIQNEVSSTSIIRSGAFQIFDLQTPGLAGFANLFSTTDTAAPTTWDLAPLDSGPFSGFDGRVSYNVTADTPLAIASQTQSFSQRLAGSPPATLAIDLLPVPTLSSPSSPIQTDSPGGLVLNFSVPATPMGTSGYEPLVLAGFAPGSNPNNPLEGVLVTWSIALREGSTSYTLPPIAEQILDAGDYIGSIGSLRITDDPIDYDIAFSMGGLAGVLTDEPQRTLSSSSPFELQVQAAP